MSEWKPEQFNRRVYTIEGDDLDTARRIEVIVKVDGKTLVRVQAREPGILAVVSKPDEQGVNIEIVEPGGVRFTDVAVPETTAALQDWQLIALGLR